MAPGNVEALTTEVVERDGTEVEVVEKNTTEEAVVERDAVEKKVGEEGRSKISSENKAIETKAKQRVRLQETQDKGKGIAPCKDKKKENDEAHKKVEVDLAARRMPKFQIGGTPKSPSVNPSTAQRLGVRLPSLPSSEPSKKRPSDDRIASAKRHKSEDPTADVRPSRRGAGIDNTNDRQATAELLQNTGGSARFLSDVPNLMTPKHTKFWLAR